MYYFKLGTIFKMHIELENLCRPNTKTCCDSISAFMLEE